MQRVSEVTDFNMDRFQLIWNRIWAELSAFFNYAGTHKNRRISELAIDHLKQLARSFLSRKTIVHYQFQKDFLDPFEKIYENIWCKLKSV